MAKASGRQAEVDWPSRQLSYADAAQVIRLVGSAAQVQGDVDARRRFVLRAAVTLTASDGWAWSAIEESRGRRRLLAAAGEGPAPQPDAKLPSMPTHSPMAVAATTHSPTAVDPAPLLALWRSAHDDDARAGHAHVHASAVQCGPGQHELLVLYRDADRPPFTSRETALLDLLLSAVHAMRSDGGADAGLPRPESLSPRVRELLGHLLDGIGRKEAAQRMGISLHTANEYAKQMFSHLGVTSQEELIRRFADVRSRIES